MKLDTDKGSKVTEPDFSKNSGSSINFENVVKMTVFRLFLENGSNDFVHFRSECRGDSYEDICKKPHVQKMSVLEIFIHKVAILAKNGKSGVQRSRYISRRVNATENLIRYSESTIICFPCRLVRFLPTGRLQGENLT